MAYIGKSLDYGTISKQVLTANGSTTVFTLDQVVRTAKELIVSVGGVVQEPDVVYSASGTTLTFTTAPINGHRVWVIFLGRELSDGTYQDNVMTTAKFQNNAVTNAKIAALAASKLTGALPAINGAALTGVATDFSAQYDNIALLGFKLAAQENLAKYDLVDQMVDEYYDTTGIAAYNGVDAVLSSGITDSSSSAHTITTVGDTAASNAQTTIGTHSLLFDGTGDNLRLTGSTDNSDFIFTGDFTVEFYFRMTDVSRTEGLFNTSISGGTGGASDIGIIINCEPNSTVDVQVGNGSANHWDSSDFTPANDTWYHFAAVRQGTTLRNYANGVQTSSRSMSGTVPCPADLRIGTDTAAAGYNLSGNMDSIRVSNICRYPNGTTFTPNTAAHVSDANTKLLIEAAAPTVIQAAVPNTGSSSSATAAGSNPSKYYSSGTTNATMDLVSTTTTALAAPATGSIVTLIENFAGTATLNTDIKGYISRNGGTGWDQVTLADKGTWGTNKKILTANDKTFSNSASGTDMKYKIETANQSYTAGVGAYQDHSSSSHTITNSTAVAVSTTQKKFGTHSLYYDGTGDHLETPDGSTDFAFGTGDFTIEFWYYGSNNSGRCPFISNTYSGQSANDGFLIRNDGGYLWLTTWNTTIGSASSIITPVNTWAHIAVTSSSRTVKIWINGVQGASFTNTHSFTNTKPVLIGRDGWPGGHSAANKLNGYLDEVRISNVARYTSAFTPSTSAFTSDANTKLLIHGEALAASGKQTRVHAVSMGWQ